MVIPEKPQTDCQVYQIDRFWDDEFKRLEYVREPFNDPTNVARWLAMGFSDRICGEMCDMRRAQPSWNHRFIEFFTTKGWQDIGTSYYRMTPGTIIPEHGDLYKAYVARFQLHGKEQTIRRAIVFLEDWQPGHYLDCAGHATVHWTAGHTVEWRYDTPHTAANVGYQDRYTLQITGHI